MHYSPLITCSIAFILSITHDVRADFLAGAAVADVTPKKFPVLVNGGMLSRSADQVSDPVNARAIALSDGEETLVIVTVDSCMMPRPLLDKAKKIASEKADIAPDRILISSTHTHTAPSCMGALGTDADPAYQLFLTKKLVDAILAPLKKLEPAEVGYGSIDAADYTALRRWVIRPDRMQEDPFGNRSVRANMHAAGDWDNVTGPSGPEDPELGLISLRSSAEGKRPIAVLANFSMHYFGGIKALSADYFGLFSEGLRERIQPEAPGDAPGFVGIMSHGCSGDIWRRDYALPPEERNDKISIEQYTGELLDLAMEAYGKIEYSTPESIAMAEHRMTLDYRVPDQQRLEWARRVVEKMESRDEGDRQPKDKTEVYAREQIILHEKQNTEIVIQALRIGEEIAIATTPNETYAITGLKIKNASPIGDTMVIELANGGDGYIPPPEQHLLGGYNTWPARSAGLEVQAEPKIAATAIRLLEEVSEKPRTDRRPGHGPAAQAVLDLEPLAYWRLDEFSGPRAVDASPHGNDAIYEPQVLFQLEGPHPEKFSDDGRVNRAAHFAGHRLRARLPELGEKYTVSLWFWNGMPVDGREITGWIFCRDFDNTRSKWLELVGIGGASRHTGKLIQGQQYGNLPWERGDSVIKRWTWHHFAYVRERGTAGIYFDGQPTGPATASYIANSTAPTLFFAGSADNQFNFEGRLDEIAVFDRVLTKEEVAKLAKP